MRKIFLLFFWASSGFAQVILPAPQNFEVVYGFAVKGGQVVEGAILTWDAVPTAENYIVSWMDKPEDQTWYDVALTFDPEHIDNSLHRKDIPQWYRVRAIRTDTPNSEWTIPQSMIFPSFIATGETGYSIPFYHFPNFQITLPSSSTQRTATGEWAEQIEGPWSAAPWQSPKPIQFFRLSVP